jgi:hypothetical protein
MRRSLAFLTATCTIGILGAANGAVAMPESKPAPGDFAGTWFDPAASSDFGVPDITLEQRGKKLTGKTDYWGACDTAFGDTIKASISGLKAKGKWTNLGTKPKSKTTVVMTLSADESTITMTYHTVSGAGGCSGVSGEEHFERVSG